MIHVVDGFCSLQYAVLSKNPSAQSSCSVLFDRWILAHGPPKEAPADGGPESRIPRQVSMFVSIG